MEFHLIIYSDMDIDKELEDIFKDPLMDVSYQEAKLFDLPADMKEVMAQKKDAPYHVAQENCVRTSHSLSHSLNMCIRN